MNLFKLVQQSIYNPEFYRSLKEKPFSFSLKYFVSIAIFFSVLITAVVSIFVIPLTHRLIQNIGPEILEHIPKDMEVRITNGVMTTNIEEPFIISMPKRAFERENFSFAGLPKNLLVIDTAAAAILPTFHEYDTLVLFTKDAVLAGKKGDVRVSSLTKMPPLITRQTVENFFEKLSSSFGWIVLALVFVLFLFAMIWMGGKLIYLFFGALVIMLIGKVKKFTMQYREAYRVGMHAITASIFFDIAIRLYAKQRIPFLFTVIMCVVIWINLKREKSDTKQEGEITKSSMGVPSAKS